MALHVRVRFPDSSEWTRDYPGLSWKSPGSQALFSAARSEAEAGHGSPHAGAWMEYSTEEETSS